MTPEIEEFRWSLMEQLEVREFSTVCTPRLFDWIALVQVRQLFHVHMRALKQVFWIKASPCVSNHHKTQNMILGFNVVMWLFVNLLS